MDTQTLYLLAADATLLLHTSFVAFVVVGLILIFAGRALGWVWVRNPWFRIVHLGCIVVVVLQAWLGILCPLTILEMELRSRAGDEIYAGSFITHWLQSILYYQAPAWVFTVCYSLFGLAVALSWIWVRPRRFRGKGPRHASRQPYR